MTDAIFVYDAAVKDYCAKVEPGIGIAAARSRIMAAEKAILAAAAIGCHIVRLSSRARLTLCGTIVTGVVEPERKRSARVGNNHSGVGHIRRNDKGRQKWRCSMEEMER